MKYRSALAIHFKPGKSRAAIPLLRDLWNGATIMRRVGKENALIAMYKDFETLEEMNISGRETFLDAGGESFNYIPCLNTDESWIDFLVTASKR